MFGKNKVIIHFLSPCVLEQCKKKEPRVNPGGLIWCAAILTLSSHHSLPMKAATSTENEVGSFNKEEGDKPFNERKIEMVNFSTKNNCSNREPLRRGPSLG